MSVYPASALLRMPTMEHPAKKMLKSSWLNDLNMLPPVEFLFIFNQQYAAK
jgi:hypothetical protein